MIDILIFIWLATLVLAAIACWYIGLKYLRLTFPKGTKRLVTRLLRRHGALREWRVLTDVTLGEGEQAVTVDQLVVGPFGVLVVGDLYHRGDAYGDLEAREWTMQWGKEGQEKKARTQNPYHAASQGVEQLRQRFAKEKIYKVQVEAVVVATQGQGCYVPGAKPFFYDLRGLKGLLETSRFEKDNGLDIGKIVGLFETK